MENIESTGKTRRILSRVLLILLLTVSVFSFIQLAPVVHAATPTLDAQVAAVFSNTAAGTSGNIGSTATGELIVVMIGVEDTHAADTCASSTYSVSSISYGSVSGSWTEVGGKYQCGQQSAANLGIADMWYAFTTSTSATSVTLTLGAAMNEVWFTTSTYTNTKGYTLLSNVGGSCSTNGSCPSPTSSTSVNYASNDVLVSDAQTYIGGFSAAGSGFTALNFNTGASSVSTCVTANGPTQCFQYQVPSSAAATNFPSTMTAGGHVWGLVGADFGSGGGSLPPFAGNCSSSTTCTSRSFNATLNSAVVVAVEWNSSQTTVTSVKDSLGNTYTQAAYYFGCTSVITCTAGNVVSSGIWFFPTANALSKITITITMSASTNSLGFELYDLSGVTGVACTGFGSTGSSTTLQIFGPNYCPVQGGQYAIAALGGLAKQAISAGATFTLTGTADVNFAAQESTTITTSTAFPATIASATPNVDVGVVFSVTPSSAVFTIGSCPTKDTSTTALTNATAIMYTGTVLQNQQLNTVSTEVASVNSGHSSPESLFMAVYAAQTPGTITATNPMSLIGVKQFVLTATSTPQLVSWSPSITFSGIGVGVTWGLALFGNSKILINQSLLAGMSTATGSGSPPLSFTSITGVSTQLYLCGNVAFQSVATTTVTSTVTSFSTTTTTATSTANGGCTDLTSCGNASTSYSILLILLLGPAILLGGVLGAVTKSGAGALGGAAVGLGVGAAIGNIGSLIPLWIVGVTVLFIIGIIVMAYASLRGG